MKEATFFILGITVGILFCIITHDYLCAAKIAMEAVK
jgi:hypothetical protein